MSELIQRLDITLLVFVQKLFGESAGWFWEIITTMGTPPVIVCVIAIVK